MSKGYLHKCGMCDVVICIPFELDLEQHCYVCGCNRNFYKITIGKISVGNIVEQSGVIVHDTPRQN